MALIVDDSVVETSTTTGTGALTLAGAVTGFRAFSSVMTSPSDTCYYLIEAIDGSGNRTGEWETGLGTYSGANTLTRTTTHKSSNANAAVSFSAGTKRVMICATASYLGTAYRSGGTDVAIADGGTGASSASAGWAALLQAAVASDLNTGTDTTKAVTADALAGSKFGTPTVTLQVSDPNGSAITTGDGKAYYRIPSTLNGMNLVAVAAAVTTVSSSGIPTVQIANVTDAVDMLSTKLTIDASETDSSTAAAAAVIDAAHDDVATGDMLRIDIDVAGTGAKGLMVEMQFQLP